MPAERTNFQPVRAPQIVRTLGPDEFLDRTRYVGYFANEHGEQAIYTYDFETGEATLRMGDSGW
jgi:hypothetical protein